MRHTGRANTKRLTMCDRSRYPQHNQPNAAQMRLVASDPCRFFKALTLCREHKSQACSLLNGVAWVQLKMHVTLQQRAGFHRVRDNFNVCENARSHHQYNTKVVLQRQAGVAVSQ